MSIKHSDKEKSDKDKKQPLGQPDPETLHTTDPQEHMKGPLSSAMQKVKEGVEDNDEQDRQEVDPEHG
jgi:hypothetical protein